MTTPVSILSSAEYSCRSVCHHPYRYFRWEISWKLVQARCSIVFFLIYYYIIIFVQGDTFIAIIVPSSLKWTPYTTSMLTVFLPLSDISVPTDHSLHASFLPSDVWNKCQIDVTSGSSAILKISSTVEAWSYDKSGYIISGYKNGYIISDTSFKVDDTVFDWTFNINFTGVEVCIGLSYKVSVVFWVLIPRFLSKKNFNHNRILIFNHNRRIQQCFQQSVSADR